MTTEEAIDALKELFEVDELVSEQKLDKLQWDSMAMLSVIALAKSKCNRRIAGTEIRGYKTIQDILNVLK